MSRNAEMVDGRPEDVFAVLSDGWSYATWVVGAARIWDVDAGWPSVDTKIHHSVGIWPLLLSDTTSVVAVDAPRSIELRARAWPTGEAHIRVTCKPHGPEQTTVTMEEWTVRGPAKLIPRPLQDAGLRLRNREALRRLGYLVSSRSRTGEH